MSDLKVTIEEYLKLADDVERHGRDTQETLETFAGAMKGVRQVGFEYGDFAERLDVFIAHIELCAQKPGIFAEELAANLRDYASQMEEGDKAIY